MFEVKSRSDDVQQSVLVTLTIHFYQKQTH